MTRKIPEETHAPGGGEKASLPKKPRKKKEPPDFDFSVLNGMLGEHPTYEEFEHVFTQLKKAFIERILSAELTNPLGYERGGSQ